jgi:hypothetical protein
MTGQTCEIKVAGRRSWGAALIAWDAAPSPSRMEPQKRKYVTQITDGRGAASYIRDNRHTRWKKGNTS